MLHCDLYIGFLTDECTVGKTLAYTSVEFFNSKGQLAARGSHTKYVEEKWPLISRICADLDRYIAGTLGPDGAYVAPPEFTEEVD